jgi:glycosyltransferase involved in cell wall biosynthesis
MRKIRILHITESLIAGGVEKFLVDLLANLDADKFEASVLSVFPQPQPFIFAEVLDRLSHVKVFFPDKPGKRRGILAVLKKISKIMKTFRPDIVHCHLNGIIYAFLPTLINRVPVRLQTVHLDALLEAHIVGEKIQMVSKGIYKILKFLPGKAAKRIKHINDPGNEDEYREYQVVHLGKKFRVYKNFVPGYFFEKACVGSRLLAAAYKRLKFTPVAISVSVEHSLKKIYRLNGHIPMIHNGIDHGVFQVNPKVDQGSGSENQGIKIVHIGRFDPAKNHELLIDAFAIVSGNFPGTKLLLIGEGDYRARIMKKVVKNNLTNHVDFLGVRKDIARILSGCDIFVLSSISEGFGLALVEAMAMGLPVVSTNVGGVREVVRDGVNGILVEPNAPGAMAEAIEELIKDKERREQMGKKGIEIAKGFDIQITTRKYNELYYRLYKNVNEKRKKSI